jgi:antitoxin component YwqK of YwqJK toxin-antitoxin module
MQDNNKPKNAKGQPHGLWESYWENGQILYKSQFINGERHGLWEGYWTNGQLRCKIAYILGVRDGLCLWYNQDGIINEIRFYAR